MLFLSILTRKREMSMKKMKRGIAWMLTVLLLLPVLAGCAADVEETTPTTVPTVPETTQATEPVPTIPADGNPEDVTCKGSYSDEAPNPGAVVAVITRNPEMLVRETEPTEEESQEATEETTGEEETPELPPVEITLTNAQLQVWYWMEVAAFRASGQEGPDFAQSLDTQLCSLDDTAVTWQQYFLDRALKSWHTSQGLIQMSQDAGLPIAESYNPNLWYHELYLIDIPATRYLYGYNKSYSPNALHQAYLDNLPQVLEELALEKGFASAAELAEAAAGAEEAALQEYARVFNLAYMYYASLHYYLEPSQEAVEAKAAEFPDITGKTVDIRHILLVPQEDTEEAWAACEAEAAELLTQFLAKNDHSEPRFSELAHEHSQDSASAPRGGIYYGIQPGQLAENLDAWCFDAARSPGDTELIRTDRGWHILYFSAGTENSHAAAREALMAQAGAAAAATARENYLMDVEYGAIVLEDGDSGLFSGTDLLYPDVAHERFPTAPLYLQQDYVGSPYGNFTINYHGCGITTLSMLASYLTDEDLIPPILAAQFGRYCYPSGTDSMLFSAEPATIGFHMVKRSYDWKEAQAALQAGYPVVSLQQKGFWTIAGHFLLLQEEKDNGKLIIRDSNIFNYATLPGHKIDEFEWPSVTAAGSGYWIYEKKITRIDACGRCGQGTGDDASGLFAGEYICEKCTEALQRRGQYLTLCG